MSLKDLSPDLVGLVVGKAVTRVMTFTSVVGAGLPGMDETYYVTGFVDLDDIEPDSELATFMRLHMPSGKGAIFAAHKPDDGFFSVWNVEVDGERVEMDEECVSLLLENIQYLATPTPPPGELHFAAAATFVSQS